MYLPFWMVIKKEEIGVDASCPRRIMKRSMCIKLQKIIQIYK